MGEFSNMTDGLRKLFLAGVGAFATVGEKGIDIVDALAERGEAVVERGKELNRELSQKGADATSGLREDALRGMMSVMTAQERADFAAAAQRMAEQMDASAEPAEQNEPSRAEATE